MQQTIELGPLSDVGQISQMAACETKGLANVCGIGDDITAAKEWVSE